MRRQTIQAADLMTERSELFYRRAVEAFVLVYDGVIPVGAPKGFPVSAMQILWDILLVGRKQTLDGVGDRFGNVGSAGRTLKETPTFVAIHPRQLQLLPTVWLEARVISVMFPDIESHLYSPV